MNALHSNNETATLCYESVRRLRDACGGLDKAKKAVETILGRPLSSEEVQTVTVWYNLNRTIKLTDAELDEEASLVKGEAYNDRLSAWLTKIKKKYKLADDEPFAYQSRASQKLNAELRGQR